MKKEKNMVMVLLCMVMLTLLICCIVLTIRVVDLNTKVNDKELVDNEVQVQENEEEQGNDGDKELVDSNIVITKNGKVISDIIPDELLGKYVNKNDNDSYIELTKDNVVVSEPTGGNAVRVFSNEQVKLYVNYLNVDEDKKQYVSVEFYVPDNGYNQVSVYTYIGLKSSVDSDFSFKAIDVTPVSSEDSYDYSYKKI